MVQYSLKDALENSLSDYPKPGKKKWFVVTDVARELVLQSVYPIEVWLPYEGDWSQNTPMVFSCVSRAQKMANRVKGRVRGVPYEVFQPRLL